MLNYLQSNIGTIVILLIVAAVIAAAAVKMIVDRKKGKSNCGCSCESCPSASMCHKK